MFSIFLKHCPRSGFLHGRNLCGVFGAGDVIICLFKE